MSPLPPPISGIEPEAADTENTEPKASVNELPRTPASLMGFPVNAESHSTAIPLSPQKTVTEQTLTVKAGFPQKKRDSPGSINSPALRHVITPWSGARQVDRKEPDTALLASKSGYQNLIDGTRIPGVTPDLPVAFTAKRTSHKLAEQGRRNRIVVALQKIKDLLPENPAVSSDRASGSTTTAGNSKAATVEAAIEYIKVLKEQLADQERQATKPPREPISLAPKQQTQDDETSGGLVERENSNEDTEQPPSSEGYGSYVEQWQENTKDSSGPYELGILGRLTHEALKLYKHILQSVPCNVALANEHRTKLKRYYDMLVLWADEHNVLDGSLDRSLQTSGTLQRTTLEHLTSVSRCLADRLFPHIFSESSGPKNGQTNDNYTLKIMIAMVDELRCMEDADEWSKEESLNDNVETLDASDGEDDWNDMLEDLDTYIQCLTNLGTSLENPAPDADYDDEEAAPMPLMENKEAYQYYADIIRSKFPLASSSLIDFLGRENWCRYGRLQAEWSDNSANTGVQKDGATNAPVEQGNSASVISDPVDVDSGLGMSLRTPSVYGFSAKSVFAERNLQRILKMSNESKEGHVFPCSVCGKTIVLRNKGDLRTHLFEDLQPYVCIYEECGFSRSTAGTILKNRQMWCDHFDNGPHPYAMTTKGYECALCLEVYEGSSVFAIHLAEHLENIALTTLS